MRLLAHPNLQPGVTLIELAVVLVILSVVALVGAPSYSEWTANARVRGIAEALTASLRFAQSESIRRNDRVDLVFTNDAPLSATVSASATGNSWVVRTNGVAGVLDGKHGDEGGRGVQLNASQPVVGFNALGRLDVGAAPVVVNIAHPGASRPLRVLLRPSGSVRLCDPAIAGPDPRACS